MGYFRKLVLAALVCGWCALGVGAVVRGQTITKWTNPGTGNWLDAGNWSHGIPFYVDPDNSNGYATIDNGGGATLSAVAPNILEINVGNDDEGRLEISNGGALAGYFNYIGRKAGSFGSALVTGAGSRWSTNAPSAENDFYVGYEGSAKLEIADGGAVSNKLGHIGFLKGAEGTVEVRDPGSRWENVLLSIGEQGSGKLTISNGAEVVTLGQGSIGGGAGRGDVLVTGAGSRWSTLASVVALRVGGTGTASLAINDGGRVDVDGDAQIDGPSEAGSQVLVSGAGSLFTTGLRLHVGAYSLGKLIIENGGKVYNAGSSVLGWQHGAHGEALVTGAGTLWESIGGLGVGSSGSGDLTVEKGAQIKLGGGGGVSHGSAKITGLGSAWDMNAGLNVYGNGESEVLVNDRATISSAGGDIGDGDFHAKVHIHGTGAKWTNSGVLKVGEYGSGEVLVDAGATITSARTIVGDVGIGKLTLTGAGSQWTNNGNLLVGGQGSAQPRDGEGTLTIADGAKATAVNGSVGASAQSKGTATVEGAGSSLVHSGSLTIGEYGEGHLTVADGALLSSSGGGIGQQAGSIGKALVSGAGSRWENSSGLTIGPQGTGELQILAGGHVSSSLAYIGLATGSVGEVLVSGVDSTWSDSVSIIVGLSGQAELRIADGGIVSAPVIAALAQGQILVEAGGTLIAPLVNISGAKIVNQGAIQGDIQVTSGGLVTGSGVFDGTMTIGSGGAFSPGGSPGTAITPETLWNAGGEYVWEINAIASAGGGEGTALGWDLWNTGDLMIGGTFTIAVTSLALDNQLGPLATWTPGVAQQWKIATTDGDDFLSLANLVLDTTGFKNSLAGGQFSLSGSPDGSALYLNFTPVPEPATVLSLAIGAGLLAIVRRNRARSLRGPRRAQ